MYDAAVDDKDRAEIADGIERGAEIASRTAVGIADDIKRGVAKGIQTAERALAPPADADVSKLVPTADLPELLDDGLSSLLVRLDRESDLLRALGLRTLSRAAWIGRFAVASVVASVLCVVTIAGIAGVLAIAGGENLGGRGGLLAVAVLSVLVSSHFASRYFRDMEQDLRALAERAIDRARETESRLARVGVAAAFRACGVTEYQVALVRLEYELSQKRDPSAPSP